MTERLLYTRSASDRAQLNLPVPWQPGSSGRWGSGVPGEAATPTIWGRNREATDFATSNLLKSRGILVRDFQFVGTESQRISRPRIPWNRGATEFKTSNLLKSGRRKFSRSRICWNGFPTVPTGITIVWTVGARVAKGGKLQTGQRGEKKIGLL
jgi:hypothetical protein